MVHLTSVHVPDDTRIAARECRSMQGAGYSVTLVAPDVGRAPHPGVTTILIDRPSRRVPRMILMPWRVFAAAWALRAQIYHLHDPELIPVGVALKLLGRCVVYDVHENLPKQILGKRWIPRWLRPGVARLSQVLEGLADLLFDAIVVANATSLGRFNGKHTVLVQNFPDLEEFAAMDAPAYRDRKPLVVYVGAISLDRGLWSMVGAMANVRTPGARLLLAGPISPELLKAAVSRPGWDRVEALGWQTRAEVQKLLSRSRIGLAVLHPLPNYLDNYPSKLFEYMASGIPSIVSDFPLWRRIIEQAECGMTVDPLDVKAIARGIDELLTAEDTAERAGKRGHDAVQTKLNWRTEADKLAGLYATLADGRE